jgi:hypothetical protein
VYRPSRRFAARLAHGAPLAPAEFAPLPCRASPRVDPSRELTTSKLDGWVIKGIANARLGTLRQPRPASAACHRHLIPGDRSDCVSGGGEETSYLQENLGEAMYASRCSGRRRPSSTNPSMLKVSDSVVPLAGNNELTFLRRCRAWTPGRSSLRALRSLRR